MCGLDHTHLFFVNNFRYSGVFSVCSCWNLDWHQFGVYLLLSASAVCCLASWVENNDNYMAGFQFGPLMPVVVPQPRGIG